MMKRDGAPGRRSRVIRASALAQCCVCEQQVLFDATRGFRRTRRGMQDVEGGLEVHAAFHRSAQRAYLEVDTSVPDRRCFVASCCFGPDAPETEVLRRSRDRVLRSSRCGRAFVALYYRCSPGVVRVLEAAPGLRRLAAAALSRLVAVLVRRESR